MSYVWISRGEPGRLRCDYEVCEFGMKILVRFKNPDTPLSYAIQAGVSVCQAEGMTAAASNALVALGFSRPVAEDAIMFVIDLLRRFDATRNLPAMREVLGRVEFRQ